VAEQEWISDVEEDNNDAGDEDEDSDSDCTIQKLKDENKILCTREEDTFVVVCS
jgi:hypothetical protein